MRLHLCCFCSLAEVARGIKKAGAGWSCRAFGMHGVFSNFAGVAVMAPNGGERTGGGGRRNGEVSREFATTLEEEISFCKPEEEFVCEQSCSAFFPVLVY